MLVLALCLTNVVVGSNVIPDIMNQDFRKEGQPAEKPRAVACLLLGGNVLNEYYSMTDRPPVAYKLLTASKHADKKHVYFVSGHRGEAVYMEMAIDLKYYNDYEPMKKFLESRYIQFLADHKKRPNMWLDAVLQNSDGPTWNDLKKQAYREGCGPRYNYQVIKDTEARFTVENYLKILGRVNKFCRDFSVDVFHLVTSQYHMPRSHAILKEFQDMGLCPLILRPMPRESIPEFDERDTWLTSEPTRKGNSGFLTNKAAMASKQNCARDSSSAHCFATIIAMTIKGQIRNNPDVERFIKRYEYNNRHGITNANNVDAKAKQLIAEGENFAAEFRGLGRKAIEDFKKNFKSHRTCALCHLSNMNQIQLWKLKETARKIIPLVQRKSRG